MSFITLSENYKKNGYTYISNRFILEILPTINNADYLKVYLYCIMHAQNNIDIDINSVAENLSVDIKNIEAAFRYFERRSLVIRLSDNPVSYEFIIENSGSSKNYLDMKYREIVDMLYPYFQEKRVLHGSEIAMVQEWIDEFKVDRGVICVLIQHMVQMKSISFKFKDADKIMTKMVENGVKDLDDALDFLTAHFDFENGAKSVLRRFKQYRNPTEDEMELYKKWVNNFHLSQKDILSACKATINGTPSFGYLDAIIKGIISNNNYEGSIEDKLNKENEKMEKYKNILKSIGYSTTKKSITPAVSKYLDIIMQEYNDELIQYVAGNVSRRGGKLNDLTFELSLMKENNISSVEDAKKYYNNNLLLDEILRKIYEKVGIRTAPSSSDRKLLSKWMNNYKYAKDIILYAAELSSGKNSPMAYLNEIIEKWHENNIDTLEKALDKAKEYKINNVSSTRKGKMLAHQDYSQREYNDDDFTEFDMDAFLADDEE